MQETWVQSLGREDPLERKWQLIPVFLPGESHGRRSLVGYSPWVLGPGGMVVTKTDMIVALLEMTL